MTGCYLCILYMLLSENILHPWQTTTFVNVNITISINYTLTHSNLQKHLPKNAAHLK